MIKYIMTIEYRLDTNYAYEYRVLNTLPDGHQFPEENDFGDTIIIKRNSKEIIKSRGHIMCAFAVSYNSMNDVFYLNHLFPRDFRISEFLDELDGAQDVLLFRQVSDYKDENDHSFLDYFMVENEQYLKAGRYRKGELIQIDVRLKKAEDMKFSVTVGKGYLVIWDQTTKEPVQVHKLEDIKNFLTKQGDLPHPSTVNLK